MIKLVHSIPLLYLALLAPGRYAIWGLFDQDWYYGQMMYDSGVWSVRLLLLTLAVTPVLLLINWTGRGKPLGRWMLHRRRHFGLASFIYATLHLVHYTIETASAEGMVLDALRLEFAVGWLAFVIFALLAATSNASAVRRLGRGWKRLHVWIYPAIGLTFLHWYLFDRFTERVLFWFMLFLALKGIHGAMRAAAGR